MATPLSIHGDKFIFTISSSGDLLQLEYKGNKLKSEIYLRSKNGFVSSDLYVEPDIKLEFKKGLIKRKLFNDINSAGLSEKHVLELINIFRWDIDFSNDLRRGDSFSALFEKKYVNGKEIGDGDILYASFVNNGKLFEAFRFINSNGYKSYYTAEGKMLHKPFLRSPVDYRRISSHFHKERWHPIKGKRMPHKGVDFAAPIGTPVVASGTGRVTWAGPSGGYGNTLVIDHGGDVTTLYGHLNSFERGVRAGVEVKQGDVIAYVGNTGLSTGPHLHYEFRVKGVHMDPVKIALPNEFPIPASDLDSFKARVNDIKNLLKYGLK